MIHKLSRSLLIFIFIGFVSFTSGLLAQDVINTQGKEVVFDPGGILKSAELEELRTVIYRAQNDLKSEIKVAIYANAKPGMLGQQDKDLLLSHHVPNKTSSQLLFIISDDNKTGTLAIGGKLKDYLTEDERSGVEAQLFQNVIAEGEITQAVKLVTNELAVLVNRYKADQVRIAQDQQGEEEHKPAFWSTIIFLVLVSIIHGLIYLKNGNKTGGKQYENAEFYTLSRFGTVERYAIVGIILAISLIIYYFTIYFYDDMLTVGFITFVVSIPLANSVLFVIIGIISLRIPVDEAGEPKQLSILEKKILLNLDLSGFKLMKLNFASLLLSGKISIMREDREMRNGSVRSYYIVTRGDNFDKQTPTKSERPFLTPLQELNAEKGYYLHYYTKEVNNRINGLKSYKRDDVMTSMVKKGVINKKYWSVNIFKRTPMAEKIVLDINKELEKLSHQLTTFSADGSGKIPLNMDYLLFDNYESILKDIGEVNNSDEVYEWGDAIRLFDFLLDEARMEEEITDDSGF